MNINRMFLGLFTILVMQLQGQSTMTIKVYGNCGMCQDRIEKTAKNVIGVNTATWNDNDQVLTITFQEGLFTEMDLHQELAAIGHDTDKMKASDEVYENLHGCCKYERPESIAHGHDKDSKGDLGVGAQASEVSSASQNEKDSGDKTVHGDHEHEADEVAGMIYEKTAEGELQPLVAANVYWANTVEGTTTDVDGHFVMKKNDLNTNLVVSYIGFVSDTIDMSGQSLVAITLPVSYTHLTLPTTPYV